MSGSGSRAERGGIPTTGSGCLTSRTKVVLTQNARSVSSCIDSYNSLGALKS